MNIYLIFIIILVIIVIVCLIEHLINKKNIKFTLKCPKSYYVYKKSYNDCDVILLVYNKKWYEQNKSNLPAIFNEEYVDKIIPQITLIDRVKIIIGNNVKKIENIKNNSPINNAVDTIVPFVTSFSDILAIIPSKYRIRLLSYSGDETPNIVATSTEKMLYVF